MKTLVATLVSLVALALPTVASAGKVVLDDTFRRAGSTQVSIVTRKPAAFKVLLRTSTQGRTRLYLLGTHAPRGGALIDTKTYACDGAAGSFYCSAAYDPLPKGSYTFRIVFVGTTSQPASVELAVRW